VKFGSGTAAAQRSKLLRSELVLPSTSVATTRTVLSPMRRPRTLIQTENRLSVVVLISVPSR
jgi:hypothetical protein